MSVEQEGDGQQGWQGVGRHRAGKEREREDGGVYKGVCVRVCACE